MKIDLMQLEFIDLNLRKLTQDIENRFGEKIITSLFRIDDSGVHGQLPLRGIDLRCESARHGAMVEQFVNQKWSYDSKRPEKKCCVYHKNRSNSFYHLHLQTHPNTKEL